MSRRELIFLYSGFEHPRRREGKRRLQRRGLLSIAWSGASFPASPRRQRSPTTIGWYWYFSLIFQFLDVANPRFWLLCLVVFWSFLYYMCSSMPGRSLLRRRHHSDGSCRTIGVLWRWKGMTTIGLCIPTPSPNCHDNLSRNLCGIYGPYLYVKLMSGANLIY